MAKKRQSKAQWRRRGEPLEEAARAARERADQVKRTGGSLASKADSQLFSVEAGSSGGARKRQRAQPKKMLWVDRVVAANPHVAVVGHTGPVKAPELSYTRNGKQQVAAKLKGSIAASRQRSAMQTKLGATTLDIWANEPVAAAPPQRRATRPRAPEASGGPAVKVDHEGASYRPTEEAHRALLDAAVAHELELQRREKAKPTMREPSETSALLGVAPASDDDDDDDDEGNVALGERPKLTVRQRNKQWRARERLKVEQAKKREAKREKQLGRIGPLLSEIRKEETQTTHRQSQRAEWSAGKRKQLGKLRYETKQPSVLLQDELPKNLRALPATDSLLQDRFESLQERNMIEVRQRAKAPRRAKRSTVLRESHKDTKYRSPYLKEDQKPAWV